MLRTLSCVFASGVALFGCDDRAAVAIPLRTLTVVVQSDDGQPVAGALVEDAQARRGTSDASGRLLVDIPVALGRVQLRVRCPAGFRQPPARQVDVRAGASGAPLSVAFQCRPTLRKVAVAVYAPGAEGRAVLIDGARIGQVAADATFHAAFEREPEARFRVAIASDGLPVVDGVKDVQLADHDELVVLVPKVVAPTPPPPARRKRTATRALAHDAPYVPYAIHRVRG